MTTSVAVIGLDGLDRRDVEEYGFPGEWYDHHIETSVHTCPSWNAIFSGVNVNDYDVYDFWKIPEDYTNGNIAPQSNERFSYEEMHAFVGSYVWDEVDVDVLSAPVVLPAYSNVYPDNEAPSNIGWPTSVDEVEHSMERMTEFVLEEERDRVLTVYPEPDKPNHLCDNHDKDYGFVDKDRHIRELVMIVEDIMEQYERWMFISDHGRPTAAEWVTNMLRVVSHEDTGLVASNCIDCSRFETNLDLFEGIQEVVAHG